MSTKFQRTPITEASDQQIRDFCELHQLDVSDAKGRPELLAVLGPAWEHDWITTIAPVELDEDEAAAFAEQGQAPVIQGRSVGGIGADDPKFTIKIGNAPVPGGNDPVPIGCNGKTIVIQRNLAAEVPARYYYILENAIREEVTQDSKTGEIRTTDLSAYPMQVISRPSEAELKAWRERTDNEVMPA